MYFDLKNWPDSETKRALMMGVWEMMWEGWMANQKARDSSYLHNINVPI